MLIIWPFSLSYIPSRTVFFILLVLSSNIATITQVKRTVSERVSENETWANDPSGTGVHNTCYSMYVFVSIVPLDTGSTSLWLRLPYREWYRIAWAQFLCILKFANVVCVCMCVYVCLCAVNWPAQVLLRAGLFTPCFVLSGHKGYWISAREFASPYIICHPSFYPMNSPACVWHEPTLWQTTAASQRAEIIAGQDIGQSEYFSTGTAG